MAINKVIYGSNTLIDLTPDSVTPETLQQGITAHNAAGEPITGTSTKDSDTSDATLTVAEAPLGKTFYARGDKQVGTAPVNGGIEETISSVDETVTIPFGYHDGSGKVEISETEKEKIIPANIKQGITVLGVEGEYTGEGTSAQSKTAIPSSVEQIIQPDEGYDYLSSVTVNPIPYTETENSAGGITVTIGA